MENPPYPVLSVYLSNPRVKSPHAEYLLTQFHSLIHQNLTKREQNLWEKDIKKIEDYLRQDYDPSAARSAVFFTSGENLWEVLLFEFAIEPCLKVSGKPYLKVLKDVLKNYQKYLVLLVDREKARLFTVHLGRVEEQKDFFEGEVPQRVRAKTYYLGRTDKVMRHIEVHLNNHLKFIALKTRKFILRKNIRFVIIGGHHELLPKLRRRLTYPVNKMVRGEFITGLDIPSDEILVKSKRIASLLRR